MRTPRVSFPLPASLGFTAILVLGSGCGPAGQESATQEPDVPLVQIDHVILAVGDLDSGIAEFEELTGVRPIFGGEHPGRGTRNALVSLGTRTYLEILAPQEGGDVVDDSPGLVDLIELTPSGWAASTTDMQGTIDLLEANGFQPSETMAGSRATPSGGLLTWTTGSVEDPAIPGAPFFIEWGADSPHPATTSPEGCELEALTVLASEPSGLKGLLDAIGLTPHVGAIATDTEGYRMTFRCPKGAVTFQ